MKEVIEGQTEGKRGKPRIMLLDDIKTNEAYEIINRRALDSESWRDNMPKTLLELAEHQ